MRSGDYRPLGGDDAEEATPLVSDLDGRMPSPWRAEARPFQGVLHALFVFTCLTEFLRQIRRRSEEQGDSKLHTDIRLSEIESEMARLDISQLISGLNARGAALAAIWYSMALEADPARASP